MASARPQRQAAFGDRQAQGCDRQKRALPRSIRARPHSASASGGSPGGKIWRSAVPQCSSGAACSIKRNMTPGHITEMLRRVARAWGGRRQSQRFAGSNTRGDGRYRLCSDPGWSWRVLTRRPGAPATAAGVPLARRQPRSRHRTRIGDGSADRSSGARPRLDRGGRGSAGTPPAGSRRHRRGTTQPGAVRRLTRPIAAAGRVSDGEHTECQLLCAPSSRKSPARCKPACSPAGASLPDEFAYNKFAVFSKPHNSLR